jgi:hypothetical protein
VTTFFLHIHTKTAQKYQPSKIISTKNVSKQYKACLNVPQKSVLERLPVKIGMIKHHKNSNIWNKNAYFFLFHIFSALL